MGKQVELLKHEPDGAGAQRCAPGVTESQCVSPVQPVSPAGRRVEQAEHVQEGRLPGPGRTNHGHILAGLHDQVDRGQGVYRRRARVGAGHPCQLDQWDITRLGTLT